MMSQPAIADIAQPIDTITILECTEDHRATKRIYLGPGERGAVIDGYDAGTWFTARSVPLDGPEDLFRVLEDTSRNPRAFVIRGISSGAYDIAEEHRRISQPRAYIDPTYVAAPHHWLALDFDKIPTPACTDPATDPLDAIEHLVGLLPPEFQDVKCWFQFTSGQGFKGDTINARLWFWLDKPAGDLQLRAWAKSTGIVDSCLYSAAEPHYIAAPILGPGVHDPVPRRYGIYRADGADAVLLTLPPAPAYTGPADWRERAGDGDGGYEHEEVAELLRHIPNPDLPYDDWLGMGVKVKAAAGADGEDAFVGWSSKSGKFNERDARAKFRSLNGAVSEHSLYLLAREHGHDPFVWRGADPKDVHYEEINIGGTRIKTIRIAANGNRPSNRPTLVYPPPAEDEDWAMADPIPSETWAVSGYTNAKSMTYQEPRRAVIKIAQDGMIDPTSWTGRVAPSVDWIVPEWIERGEVTLLVAPGGTGKSMLAQQLATAVGTGNGWIGVQTVQSGVLYVGCEDREAEMWRRQDRIASATGISHGELGDVRYWIRSGKRNVFETPKTFDKNTPPLFQNEIIRNARFNKSGIIIIDGLSHVFSGNENDPNEATQFVNDYLIDIAQKANAAVLVLHHTAKDGTQYRGTTAWPNSVRAMLQIVPDADNKAVMKLVKVKANHSKPGVEIPLMWRDGFIMPAAAVGPDEVDRIEFGSRKRGARDLFIRLFRQLQGGGVVLTSRNKSDGYAPAVMMKHPDRGGFTRGELEQAMVALLADGALKEDPYGPPSKGKSKLIEVAKVGC